MNIVKVKNILLCLCSTALILFPAKICGQSKLPEQLVLGFKLTELPGQKSAQSFWEVAYEWRVADLKAVVKLNQQGLSGFTGKLIGKSSFSRAHLALEENRLVKIVVPITDELQDTIKREAQEPQLFLLAANVRIFDAKLNKTISFKINPTWRLKLFPNGQLEINLALKDAENYSYLITPPAQLPPGFSAEQPKKSGLKLNKPSSRPQKSERQKK